MLTQFQRMEARRLAAGLKAMLTDISHARTQLVRALEYPEAPTPELVELYFWLRRQQATRLPTGRSA